MRACGYLFVACVVALNISPVLAADAMPTMSMMKGGEVFAFMPDGHMGKMMMTDAAKMDAMMKMSKPLDHCVMMMSDAKGMTYMVDTSSKEATAVCEKMAK